jgi:hypothetical protein
MSEHSQCQPKSTLVFRARQSLRKLAGLRRPYLIVIKAFARIPGQF